MGSVEFNIELPRVSDGLIGVQYSVMGVLGGLIGFEYSVMEGLGWAH